jgi:CRP-like cAMP-binding protein
VRSGLLSNADLLMRVSPMELRGKMAARTLPRNKNRILARLSEPDFALLDPHLSAIDFHPGRELERCRRPTNFVYFPESGIMSVVADGVGGQDMEVGMIGREGMTGLAIIMGNDRSPQRSFVQVAGRGWQIRSEDLVTAIQNSPILHRSLLQYAHAFLMLTGYAARAIGRSKIEERLARWLLLSRDRIDGNALAVTHNVLSEMLGVRRPGVTMAIRQLQRAKLIRADRGSIAILDRKGLKKRSNGAYGAPEANFHRLFG